MLLLPHKVRKDCAACARVLAPRPVAPRRDQAAVLEEAYIRRKYGLEKETGVARPLSLKEPKVNESLKINGRFHE